MSGFWSKSTVRLRWRARSVIDLKMLNPKSSGAFIAMHARHVRINPIGIENVAKLVVKSIEDKTFEQTSWSSASDLHPMAKDARDKDALNWCLFADAINFSFWTDGDNESKSNKKIFTVTYKEKEHHGWYACCALINRAIDNGIPFTDAEYLSHLTFEQAKTIFTGDDGTCLPMLAERRANLIETAEALSNKFDGNFANCVEEAGGNAQKLLRLIVENFPSFRDVAEYNDRPVSFYKRAQILVADVFGCLKDHARIDSNGLDSLSMFADYRVPQVLAFMEALEYSIELKDLLRKRHQFPNGDPMEVEIRGCSIHAVELIVREARKLLKDQSEQLKLVNSSSVDYFLWCYRRQHSEEISILPFHRTRCIYY